MSSDGYVSDHGRQVFESFEGNDDVEMGGFEVSKSTKSRRAGDLNALERTGERVFKARDGNGLEGGWSPEQEEGAEDAVDSDQRHTSRGGKSSNSRDAPVFEDSEGGNVPESNLDSLDDSDSSTHGTNSDDEAGSQNHGVSDEGDNSRRGNGSDGAQRPSPERIPPSYQVSPGGGDCLPDKADTSDLSTKLSKEELVAREDDAARKEEKSKKRKSPAKELGSQCADGAAESRILKKARTSFNRAYLDLLNEDIEHAAAQYVPGYYQLDNKISLPASQIGMTVWKPMEKERLFEALSRIGRDDAAGIAHRVRTKDEMEVRQYLKLLQDGLTLRRQQKELDPLELADFPAAVELSHECCQALEQAADNIASRQESTETTIEWQRHGADWLVTHENCEDVATNETEGTTSEPATVLKVPNWLMLSERLFMNGPSEEGNWQSIKGQNPSIRLTALEDFHSLVLTLTRRVVAASLYVARSRIRAERGYRTDVQSCVRVKDVHAAAISLGIGTARQSFWAGCARRLGLDVFEDPPKSIDGNGRGAMSYDAVEDALEVDGQPSLNRVRCQLKRMALYSDDDSALSDSLTYGVAETEASNSGTGLSDEAESEDEEVKAEADEAILYSAVDQPETKRGRQALFRRIKAEKEQEKYADAVDAQASYQEETRMWKNILGKQPPGTLIDPGLPASGRRPKLSVDAAYSVGKDWRAKTKFVSEWESQYQLHR